MPANASRCTGPSGAGKSTLLRSLYGNYRADAGRILVRHDGEMVDIAAPRRARWCRCGRQDTGLCQPVPARGAARVGGRYRRRGGARCPRGRTRGRRLLRRLNIPERLHALPPATFSGGEQQRVNLARGFIGGHPVLLLDEPTASLDADNRDVVIAMIAEAKARGVAIVGIFHDAEVRGRVADRLLDVTPLQDAA